MHMFIYSKYFAGSSRKNVYTLPYAFIYQKSVYITIRTKTPCTAHFPTAGSNVHTHAYAFYLKKVHTLPYIPICRQQSGKEDKTQFCGQVKCCNHIAGCTLRGAGAAPLHCFCSSITPTPCTQFAGHTPHCRAQAPPAGHTHPLSRPQKQKKDVKILATRDV